jgi:hypothetical protein
MKNRTSLTLILMVLSVSATLAYADFDLDIDDDGKTEPLTDGLLVIRYLFGFSGESLVAGAVSDDAARSKAADIEAYLKADKNQMDVDGDGEVSALTDGLLIIRSLFGFSGASLSAGAIATGAIRTDGPAVATYLETITDSDNDDTNDAFDAFPNDATKWLADGVGDDSGDGDLTEGGDGGEADPKGDFLRFDFSNVESLGFNSQLYGAGKSQPEGLDLKRLKRSSKVSSDSNDAGVVAGFGGVIAAHAGLAISVNRNDGAGEVIEVRVNRLFSSSGAVSVDYTTVDGPQAKQDVHYKAMSGTLTWADGDLTPKLVTIPIVMTGDGRQRAFSLELSNPQGGAQLADWHVGAVIALGAAKEQPAGYQGRIETGAYSYNFAEGHSFTIPVSRVRSGLGAISVDYQISGCPDLIDVDNSAPLSGTLEWENEDQSDQLLTLSFLDDSTGSPFASACEGSLNLLPPADINTIKVDGLSKSRSFRVFDNDFPEEGVIRWSQRVTFVEEGAPTVELRLIRLGKGSTYQSVSVSAPSWIDSYKQIYDGTYRFAQPGIDYDGPGAEGDFAAEWQVDDVSPRTMSVPLAEDDNYGGRDKLIVNQLTVIETGEQQDFYGFILNYEEPDRDRDSDGDGVYDAIDIDLDGDGIWNDYDADRDGDGVDNDVDSHPSDPTEQVDSDGDGIGNTLDEGSEGEGADSATDELAATNIIAWSLGGSVIENVIESSRTKFVAEAALSPDGRYLYLLTSAHIQRALIGLDPEPCSLYRVSLSDNAFTCLLEVDSGDVGTRSGSSALRFDFSRTGMVFRSDGAALFTGFNWARLRAKPEPCECAAGSVWFMLPTGELLEVPNERGWYAESALWINDDYFAVTETADESIGKAARIVIYNAQTLQPESYIEDQNGATISLLVAGESVYWPGNIMNREDLGFESNLQDGIPMVDRSGERLFYFKWEGRNSRLVSADGAVSLALTDGMASSYNWQEQSGIGTDIKYGVFSPGKNHLVYMKTFAPETPIVSIEGEAWVEGYQNFELRDGLGQIELHGTNTFKIYPSAALTADLTLVYEVNGEAGVESREVTIPANVFSRWRSDPYGQDHINWALPESEIEGFCAFHYETKENRCLKFAQYDLRAFDMESFRSARYDDSNVLCENGECNAFPGVANVVLIDGEMRVYFKDSKDDQYYEAAALVDDFIEKGESALVVTPVSNGSGEADIISEATKIRVDSPLDLTGLVIEGNLEEGFNLLFESPLSMYAALPSFRLAHWSEDTFIVGEWAEDRASFSFMLDESQAFEDERAILLTDDPIFLRNSTRIRGIPSDFVVVEAQSN